MRGWMMVRMEVGQRVYFVYLHDMLQVVLEVMRNARDVELEGVRLELVANSDERRSHTMNSDLSLNEKADVCGLHGRVAHVSGVVLHVDEAAIAWNGPPYVYPIRITIVNFRGGDAA